MESIYIFGYGSLLNPESRAKTYRAEDVTEGVVLTGYQRKLNACSDAYPDIGMNLIPNPDMSVVGVVTRVPASELSALRVREADYEEVDVTKAVSEQFDGPVYVFISRHTDCSGRQVLQTYLDTCLGGVPKDKRTVWLHETIIENEIFDDRDDPQYPNYVPLY